MDRHAPDLFVALVAYLALRSDGLDVVPWAIAIGFAQDCASLDPLGAHAFVLGFVGFVFARPEGASSRARVRGPGLGITIVGAALLAHVLYVVRMFPVLRGGPEPRSVCSPGRPRRSGRRSSRGRSSRCSTASTPSTASRGGRVDFRRRLLVLYLVTAAALAVIWGKAFWVQVADAETWQKEAAKRDGEDLIVRAPRGRILDADGRAPGGGHARSSGSSSSPASGPRGSAFAAARAGRSTSSRRLGSRAARTARRRRADAAAAARVATTSRRCRPRTSPRSRTR